MEISTLKKTSVNKNFISTSFYLINNSPPRPCFYFKLTLRTWHCAMRFLSHNEADFAVTAIAETQNP